MSNSVNWFSNELCYAHSFQAKSSMLEFNYPHINAFESIRWFKNNVFFCSMFDEIMFNSSLRFRIYWYAVSVLWYYPSLAVYLSKKINATPCIIHRLFAFPLLFVRNTKAYIHCFVIKMHFSLLQFVKRE